MCNYDLGTYVLMNIETCYKNPYGILVYIHLLEYLPISYLSTNFRYMLQGARIVD